LEEDLGALFDQASEKALSEKEGTLFANDFIFHE